MHIHSYLASAELILRQYSGDKPFDIFRKTFFAAHKKYGSKDRKHITHLCYSYFRLGKSFDQQPFEEKVLIAQYLTSTTSNVFLQQLKPEWNVQIGLSLIEKFQFLNAADEWKKVFPWHAALSPEIDEKEFIMSHLKQPDFFLRIRPGKENKVKKKLEDAGAEYAFIKDNTLVLPPNFKASEIFEIDKEVVVQDLSSQQVLDPINKLVLYNQSLTAWDCCAASGGKSLLLYDLFNNVQLTVSDIRKSILHNLHSRFSRAGIIKYNSFVDDVSREGFIPKERYDLVICDAPCSGSGTWSRTPEQLVYFDVEKINHYQQLQKKIVINSSGAVKNGGYLLYITCSVFKKENEDVVSYIKENSSLNLVSMNYYKGYNKKADTLFAALLSFDN
jgi:16S rRNA (cytosine967-C5)-methyltransferase